MLLSSSRTLPASRGSQGIAEGPRRTNPCYRTAQWRARHIAWLDRSEALVAFGLLKQLDEPDDRGRQRLLAPMDEADRADEVGQREGHGHERSDPDFLLDGMPRQQADARPDHDRLLDGLDVVEGHRDVELDVALAERAIDGLADRQPGVEGHERLAAEVRGRHRAPARQPVPWMADERHRLRAQRDDRERPILGRIRHDPDV